MRKMSWRRRTGIATVAAAMAVVSAAAPALAVAGAGVAVARSDNGLWLLTAECTAEIAATTNGRDLTFVVEGSAQGEGPAVSTAVRCYVYQNGSQIGSCGLALPGPTSACVSTATGSLELGLVTVCAEASALYLDGSRADTDPCP